MNLEQKSLFSRQIGAIGKNATERLMNTNVLMIGNNVIGIELAKCLALLGINKLVIIEPNNIKINKISKSNKTKYYHNSGNDTSKTETIVNLTKTLNQNIKCFIGNSSLFDYKVLNTQKYDKIESYLLVENIDIVLYVDTIFGLSINNLENICTKNKLKFVLGFNYGLEGYIFSNFGNHNIEDIDGEIIQTSYVETYEVGDTQTIIRIEKLENTLLSRFGILVNNKGESINIMMESSSLEELNIKTDENLTQFLIKSKGKNIRFVEKKEEMSISHKLFRDYLVSPNNKIITLNSSFEVNDKLLENKTQFINKIRESISDNSKYKKLRYLNEFPILGSIIGGILAHEVIKVTGKYIPIEQDIYFDFRELNPGLSKSAEKSTQNDVLDNETRKILGNMNIFMIGCGALGCEISKNLGIIGTCTKKGTLSITDMDTIELSNLNRQFLFRNDNIGKHKSSVTQDRLNEYFPNMKVKAFTNEVGDTSENMFNSSFWNNKNVIINALDNVEARKYVDSKCVLHKKTLLESGTLGSKCNTQTIIPYKTATYSEIIDIDDKSIPMCTIRNFPNKIEHCVEWGLDIFERLLSQSFQDLDKLINNKHELYTELKTINNNVLLEQRYNMLSLYLHLYKKKTFKDFIEFCHQIYNNIFKNPIKDILHSFPSDLTDEYGNEFWSGKKLKPTVIDFNTKNLLIRGFCKNLYEIIKSRIFKNTDLFMWNDDEFSNYMSNSNYSIYERYISKTIKVNEEKDEIQETVPDIDVSTVISLLNKGLSNTCVIHKKTCIHKISYDKDSNDLLELMTSITNLRANTYSIDLGDSLDIKMISGRIIPALSTTTTVIAGFVVIELLKSLKDISSSDININLATNSYILFDSQKPKITYNNMFSNIYGMKIKTEPLDFNTWTRWEISLKKDECFTIGNLLDILETEYNIKPMSLNIGKTIIYNCLDKSGIKTNLYDVFKKLKIPLNGLININSCNFNEEGIPILTPPIILSN